jgi:hypothetical protein
MSSAFGIMVKYAQCMAALKRISDTELPAAIAAGINRIASGASLGQLNNLRADFILRNKYTERSLVYYKANPKTNINRINAIVGSKQPYLELQEKGGTRRPKMGSRVPVPTKAARGGNWRSPIQRKYTARKGPLSSKFFILRPGAGSTGMKRRISYQLDSPAMFKRESGRLVKIRLLDQPSYRLRARRWHTDAVNKYGKLGLMQTAFIQEARRRIAKYQAT